jgi:hypothetical protein
MITNDTKTIQNLAEAQPGDLVAVGGAYGDPYWIGTVLEINPEKKLLRVLSKRFETSVLRFKAPWYNHEGRYTNARGDVLKRVPWATGTICPLTEEIQRMIAYQDVLETLTGFRTWHYGLLKDATLEQVQALIAVLQPGEKHYDTYKQFGTCERLLCGNEERELYVCSKCDREVCYECGGNGRVAGEEHPVWLCLDCYPVAQHPSDCDCYQCKEVR